MLLAMCLLMAVLSLSQALPMGPNNSWMALDKGSLDSLRDRSECRVSGKCIPTNNATCMGVKVPYPYTSNDISGMSRHAIHDRLLMLEGLRRVPKCWAAVQPMLCALFLPRCDPNTGLINLPTHEMCKIAQLQCRILNDTLQDWIPFFNCDDPARYPADCKSDVKEMRFNTTGQCVFPLVPTDNQASFYEGIDSCGLECADPMLTKQERQQIHTMVAWAATISLLCNLFAVASFVVDWRSTSNYPSLIVFYINFCYVISNMGWLAQFIPGAREDIVCRKDGTLRLSEPSGGENLSCVIVFIMVYYFLIAACVWFVILSYAWHQWVKGIGKIPVRFEKKAAYFHLVAWSLPLVLTISTMATSQIDGNSVAGICFVGYYSHSARILLLILPVLCSALVAACFLARVLTTLISVKIGSQQIISEKANRELQCNIIRVGLCLLGCGVCVVTSITCHVYEIQNESLWMRSLRKFIICRINPVESSECKIGAKPSVAMVQLHLLVLFLSGVLMSSWVWRSSTLDIWKISLSRFMNKTPNRAVMKKHKIIAQAYSKRKEINDNGRLSISINETRDPAGLNFELNSVESQDFSSTWAAALPKLVTRRGALIEPTTDSNSSQSHRRRNSYDSEISYSLRRVSVESRRHSLDSQISVQIEEFKATRKTLANARPPSSGRRKSRRRPRGRRPYQRRPSSTSQDSQMGIQILTALTMGNPNVLPNFLKRRPANAGLLDPMVAGRVPMITGIMSDDDSAHADVVIDEYHDESMSDVPNGRSMALKAIKAAPETDSDNVVSRRQQSGSRRPRRESISSGRRKRDSGHFDTRRNGRKKGHGKRSDDREVSRSKDSSGSKKRKASEGDGRGKYATCKTDDYSEEEESEWKQSSSESENDSAGKYSRKHAGGRRGESSKSKRSVDVATQVCMQEMATQTEVEAPTTHNSTQMTPPYHIRCINKTLANNGQVAAPTPRYKQ